MRFALFSALVSVGLLASVSARYIQTANAQTRPPATDAGGPDATPASPPAQATPWPMSLPGLESAIRNPHDGRLWTATTRTTRTSLSVVLASNGGQLALSFERRFAVGADAPTTCATLLASEVRNQGATYRLRAETATAFRSVPFNAEQAFQLTAGGFAVEYTCIDAAGGPWLASAMAYERAGLSLTDCNAIAVRVAEALQTRTTRADGTLRLAHTGLTLRPQATDGVWLFTGNSEGFPIISDAISTRAGDSGGATITLAQRPGHCADLWAELRPWLTDEGVRTDRPGYVPVMFGARIRRVVVGERLREVYCAQPRPDQALIVSSVFLRDDADAMLHVGELLRRVEQAIAPNTPTTTSQRTITRLRDGGTH